MRRAARLTSEQKPACLKAETWSLILAASARRKSLLAGKGNVLKARSVAKHLWATKGDAYGKDRPVIVGKVERQAAQPARVRLGNPLRNIPKAFTKKTFA